MDSRTLLAQRKLSFAITLKHFQKRCDQLAKLINSINSDYPSYAYVFNADLDQIPEANRKQAVDSFKKLLGECHIDYILENKFADVLEKHNAVADKLAELSHSIAEMQKLAEAEQASFLHALEKQYRDMQETAVKCDALLENIIKNYEQVYKRFDANRKRMLQAITTAATEGKNIPVVIAAALKERKIEAIRVEVGVPAAKTTTSNRPIFNYLQRHPYVKYALVALTIVAGVAAIGALIYGAVMLALALPMAAAYGIGIAATPAGLMLGFATYAGVRKILKLGAGRAVPAKTANLSGAGSTTKIEQWMNEKKEPEKPEPKPEVAPQKEPEKTAAASTPVTNSQLDPEDKKRLIEWADEDDSDEDELAELRCHPERSEGPPSFSRAHIRRRSLATLGMTPQLSTTPAAQYYTAS